MTINEYSILITEKYCAPEIIKKKNPKLDIENKKEYDPNLKIDITKSLSYICGKLIDHIIKIRKSKSNNIFFDQIQELVKEMTNESPEQRLDIKEAIGKIEKFGDDNFK